MGAHCKELTVDQLLDDPMIAAVMRADHVDPVSFRAMLAGLTAQLGAANLGDADPAAVRRATPAFSLSDAPALAGADAATDCWHGSKPW